MVVGSGAISLGRGGAALGSHGEEVCGFWGEGEEDASC